MLSHQRCRRLVLVEELLAILVRRFIAMVVGRSTVLVATNETERVRIVLVACVRNGCGRRVVAGSRASTHMILLGVVLLRRKILGLSLRHLLDGFRWFELECRV